MKNFGKLLQVAALVLLPVACLMEISNPAGLGRTSGLATMLVMMMFGMISFILGRFLEGYASS